ncbi:unnamed protein product, partial [Eretmochelys imbricata]
HEGHACDQAGAERDRDPGMTRSSSWSAASRSCMTCSPTSPSRWSCRGEMINRIEKNILDSENYVHKGHVHLNSARESQQKARKKKFMIIICLLVTVVIVVVIIGVAIATG